MNPRAKQPMEKETGTAVGTAGPVKSRLGGQRWGNGGESDYAAVSRR